MKQMYESVIGLEVHVELNTKTKMFCKCSADYFGKIPNSNTCPICLGLPGALPFINQQAIESCIKIGLALNCRINKLSYFERKNYFYPDLAKGFQISQLVLPLTVGGWIDVEGDSGKVAKIRINRVHQEEDTGKLTHVGSETLIDFNRSGVPLVEIVTEPDFTDSSQIRDYAKKLQQIFRFLDVSNADMEKGDMRLEANISVRPKGEKALPNYRVELKNINSFRFMVAAVEYEIKRQIQALEKGEKPVQETRGWDEDKKQTYLQRSKEDAHDYRYFPEPDLPELRFNNGQFIIEEIKKSLPELPMQKIARFVSLGLKTTDAKILAETKEMAEFFERTVELGSSRKVDPKIIANFLINQKLEIVNSSPDQILDDILAKSRGMIDDEKELEKIATKVIAENEKSVADYKRSLPPPIGEGKKGAENVINALVGAAMKKTSGKANVERLMLILKKLLR